MYKISLINNSGLSFFEEDEILVEIGKSIDIVKKGFIEKLVNHFQSEKCEKGFCSDETIDPFYEDYGDNDYYENEDKPWNIENCFSNIIDDAINKGQGNSLNGDWIIKFIKQT